MTLLIKFLPYGALPYDNCEVLSRMQSKLMPYCPFLPILPQLEKNVSVLSRTLSGFSSFTEKKGNVVFNYNDQFVLAADKVYSNPSIENTKPYRIQSPYKEEFLDIIKKNNSPYACVYLHGPFSLSLISETSKQEPLSLADKSFRKVLIQMLTIKALSVIYEIKNICKKTTPIIIFEEPLLNQLSSVCNNNPDITFNLVVAMYTKIFDALHKAGAKVGIRSMNKCYWTVPIDAGVDIISFDACRNPHNLNIIADDIKDFILRGGSINYALIPMTGEQDIQKLNIDTLYNKICLQLEELIVAGVPRKELYSATSISCYGVSDSLSLLLFEKAIICATNLAKRISMMHNLYG